MKNYTNEEIKEKLQMMDDNAPQKDTLIEYVQIENTPFTMIKYEDHYVIAMGRYIITKPISYVISPDEYMEGSMWDMLINVVLTLQKAQDEINKEEKKIVNDLYNNK